MNLDRVNPGKNIPEEFNVIIEIPAHSDPVKYEVDKETGAMFVDRFLNTAMHFPCNYGYIPHTLSLDGDPVDVLVPTPSPLISGSVIQCRPVGMLMMTDESGEDAKILAMPNDDLCSIYRDVKDIDDVRPELMSQISHFFENYKGNDEGKWVKLDGWQDKEAAKNEVVTSIQRFNDAPVKPCF